MRKTLFTCATASTALVAILGGCEVDGRGSVDWSQRAAQATSTRLASAGAVAAEPCGREPRTHGGRADVNIYPAEELLFSLAAQQSEEAAGEMVDEDGSPADEPILAGEESTEPAAVDRGPLPGFRETLKRDLRLMPEVLWSDTKAAFGDPWNLVLLASAGGASIALRTTNADDHVDEHYRRHSFYNSCGADTFGALGNPATHFALAGAFYLAGQQLQDDKTYEVGRKLFNALTITGLTTMALKVAAWDRSPNGEWGAWPSGHTSSTMAMATVLNGAYGPLIGVPMFGLTGLVAIERMDSREHWLSDVVFGAVLGWVVGETVVKEHRPELLGGEIVPYIDPVNGGAGVAWLKTLGNSPRKPDPH